MNTYDRIMYDRIMEYAELVGRVDGNIIACRQIGLITESECINRISKIIKEFESEKEKS